jgi:hypothetical protein
MRKRTTFGLMSGILILLCGIQIRSLQAAENSAAEPSSPVSVAVAANEINEMKQLVSDQQKQIEKLQSTLDRQQRGLDKKVSANATKGNSQIASAAMPASPAPAATQSSAGAQDKLNDLELVKSELEALADSTAQAIQRLTKLESDVTANKKETDAKAKQLGNFTFSGDARVRFEPFFQEGAPDRNRERIRLRFNAAVKLSDEFNAGFSLATGTLDDPVSTNQTFTGFLNRKSFGVDKAFISYKPKYAKFLKLDAGKFAYPWYRTPMTFDNDVNPEGFAQTLSFDLKTPGLTNITFVGFQLPINEVSANADSHDSFILGGQMQMQFRLSPKARLGLYGAGINFLRTDPLGVAAAGRVAGTLVGSLNNSNSLRKNGSGTVVGYAYKFAYLDAIAKLELDTTPRFPTTIIFDFVNNTRGPLGKRSGYWTEVTFGKQKEKNDLQFGYTYTSIDKDAIIAAFNESDLRSSTNVQNHRLLLGYMFHSNVQAQFTAWIGKLKDPLGNPELVPAGVRGACTGSDTSNCKDPYLKRLQFDVIYKF